MTMQTKSVAFDFEVKREPDQDATIEGIASVFDVVDQGMDVVSPGAFRKSLDSGRKPKMLWQHDPNQPIGIWDMVEEREAGLYVKGRIFKDVPKGAEAIALFKGGAMDGLSIGYRTKQAIQEGGGRVRRLVEVDLFEISCVTFPMNEYTLASVKSIASERQFEAFLRDAGYSRKEATAITLHGFKGLNGLRDAEPVEAETEGAKALFDQIRQLQEKLNV